MTTNPSSEPAEASLARDLLYAARYYLGGRRGLLVLAALPLVAGVALNWSWLVAVGIAPILIGALPCLAMCALGLCMNRAGGKSCATGAGDQESGATAADATPVIQASSPEALPPADATATPRLKPQHQPKKRSTTDA